MNKKYFSHNNSFSVSKSAVFDAEIESVEKVGEKVTGKKL
jgi:hypothetical protein